MPRPDADFAPPHKGGSEVIPKERDEYKSKGLSDSLESRYKEHYMQTGLMRKEGSLLDWGKWQMNARDRRPRQASDKLRVSSRQLSESGKPSERGQPV